MINRRILLFLCLLVTVSCGLVHGQPEEKEAVNLEETTTSTTTTPGTTSIVNNTIANETIATGNATKVAKNGDNPLLENRFFGLDGIFNQLFPSVGFNQSPFGQNGGSNGFFSPNQQFFPGNQWPFQGNNMGQGWPSPGQSMFPNQGFYPSDGSFPDPGTMSGQGSNTNQYPQGPQNNGIPQQNPNQLQPEQPPQNPNQWQPEQPQQQQYPNQWQQEQPQQQQYPNQWLPEQIPDQGGFPNQKDQMNFNPGNGGSDGTLDSIPPQDIAQPPSITEIPPSNQFENHEGETGPVPFPSTTGQQNLSNGVDSGFGGPVDALNTPPSDKIVFVDSPESPLQRQCVQDCGSSTDYEPVCGTNGVTFYNPDKLKCARKCGIDVFVKHLGRCNENNM